MRHRRVIAATAVGITALAPVVAFGSPVGASVGSRSVLSHSASLWESVASRLGHATAPVNARVYLSPKGGLAALAARATAIATPGNAEYGHFLTVAQYDAQYAPSAATVSSVASWLASDGLRVTWVGLDNHYLTVTGRVSAAEKAFGTTIDTFRHGSDVVQAPTGALSVPNDVAGAVLSVTGLDTTPSIMSTDRIAPPAAFRNAAPCSSYYRQVTAKFQADGTTPLPAFQGSTLPYAPCGYTGPQFRAAYEGNSSLDGTGVTVAITDAYASTTLASDVNQYAVNHGDGAYGPGQFVQTNSPIFTRGTLCQGSGWFGEAALDVESVHAMAPAANIHYYGAMSCEDNDLLASLTQVVHDDTAQLVTNSWGEPANAVAPGGVAADESVFLQGGVEGISFLFGSGDSGDELAATGIKQVDYPTSDPYATGVGGTSLGIGATGNIIYQSGWGTVKYSLHQPTMGSWDLVGFLYGSGGGSSTLFNQPAYQVGTSPGPYRDVPDVAMDGDVSTGMLIGLTQALPTGGTAYGEYRVGGTSMSSPLFAGLTALAFQHAGHGVGLLNPVIYAHQSAFSDIKGQSKDPGVVRVDYVNGFDGSAGLKYSVRTENQDSSLSIARGWDDVTGVGAGTPAWLTAVP
jgi:subtilase family serine protease